MNLGRLGLSLMVGASARPTPTSVPTNSTPPSIMGIQTQGQTLTANPGYWNGMPTGTYAYQWKRAGSNISGATASTYVLTGTDVGQAITVQVIATNVVGPSSPATSSAITPTATLSISGTPADAVVGMAYSFTPSSAGGHTPKTYALTGTLPSGLSFAPSTGAITGTPTASGTASGLNITVTDVDGLTASLGTFSLVVSNTLGPGIVTGVEVLGDIVIPITNPASINVTMQTNGCGLKITTSSSASHTGLDLTKAPYGLCRTYGWDPATGGRRWDLHVVTFNKKLLGPYNEKTAYQPTAGQFYLVSDDFIFSQDATEKTEVLSVGFPAGWLTGQPEGQVASGIVRSDSLAFFPFAVRDLTIPWQDACPSGGTVHVEFSAVNMFAQAKSQLACIEAWLVDKNGTAGPVTRISAMTLSSRTPGSQPGKPLPVYQADLATTGLAQGLMHVRHNAKPWRGPSQASATYGQDLGGGMNPLTGAPVYLDLDGSYVRLYGIVKDNPAAATIANNTNLSTVDTTGLSTTIAGAIASGKTYANEATLLAAVRRVNRSASPLTIAHASTGAGVSYQRTTTHDDVAAGSVVCREVVGSTPGTNTGVYTLQTQINDLPCGHVAPEFRSESGGFSDLVRWRGVNQDGSRNFGYNLKMVTDRIILRGLYLDSVGLTNDNDRPVFSGYASSDATVYTEATQPHVTMIDCKVRGDTNTGVGDPYTFTPMMKLATYLHIRCDWSEPNCRITYNSNYSSHGLYAAIGGKYVSGGFHQVEVGAFLGCDLTNIGVDSQTISQYRGPVRGRIFVNVDQQLTSVSGVTRINSIAGAGAPQIGGEGWVNCLARSTSSASANFTSWIAGGDSTVCEMDGLVMQSCGSNFPNQSDANGRLNIAYNDTGYIGVKKRAVLQSCYFPGYNIKGDTFNTSDTGSGAPTHSTAQTWYAGAIVKNAGGTLIYQAIRDVPLSTAITDATYWFASGAAPATAFGLQPRRQGNMAVRYQVGSRGVVAASSQDSNTAPSATAWYGYAFNGKVQSSRAAWFSSGSTPSISGDLNAAAYRVPAGFAPAPFDLNGNNYADNGNDAVGPICVAA